MDKLGGKLMTNAILTQEEGELLNDIMLENNIHLKDVYTCAEQHWDEIQGMMNIFYNKKEIRNQRLILTLLGLIAQEQSDKVIAFYSEVYDISIKPDFSKEDIKLILTACVYNHAFFLFALNLCERIESKLEDEAVIPNTIIVREENGYIIIEITFFRLIEGYKASAAPADDDFKEFFSEPIIYKDIKGTLHFKGDTEKRVYLEFVFDKYYKKIPFELKLCFTTTRDHKEHVIVIPADKPLSDKETNFTAIRSGKPTRDIDYSGGIEPNYKISLKLLT